MTVNCDGCKNYTTDYKCRLGKHSFIGYILDDEGRIKSLHHSCIFRNTEHDNISYDVSHKLVLSRIAVAIYFVIDTKEDIEKTLDILDKEKEYGADNPIGQVNVLVKSGISAHELHDLAKKLAVSNGRRLWNINVLLDGQSYHNYILNECKLPFALKMNNELDFANIQNFKHQCFTCRVPTYFNGITSIGWLRKELEKQNNAL